MDGDVYVSYRTTYRETALRPIGRESATIIASSAGRGGRPGSGEVYVRLRAQRGGSLREYDDVDQRESHALCAFQPTDVALEFGSADEVVFAPARRARRLDRPRYHVPSIAEVLAAPSNGRVVASTFAGAGGSSIGYRMAGFDVRWACDLNAQAVASYRANLPAQVFEGDVRDVDAAEILRACGVRRGSLDLFDGSPPCTSFSTAGIRTRGWGQVREHAGRRQRVDDLFFDYASLLEQLQPRAFVAENVAGLIRGAAIGYYKAIRRALAAAGYRVTVWLLDADELGVPQHRERVFFVGVRGDVAKRLKLDGDLQPPASLPYKVSVREALPWLDGTVYLDQGTPWGDPERIASGKATPAKRQRAADREAPTVTGHVQMGEARVVHDTAGTTYDGEPNRRDVDLDGPAPAITAGMNGINASHFQVIHDPKGIYNAQGDVTDRPGPTIRTTDQAHFTVVEQDDGTVLLKRKFTILEVKRLCSFPDDYVLEGRFAEQWAQLGNSVPPLMMRAVAAALDEQVFSRLANRRRRAS